MLVGTAAAPGEGSDSCGLEEHAKVFRHVPGRRVAIMGPLRQRLQADPLQFLGDRVVDLAGRTRLGGFDRLQDIQERVYRGMVFFPVNSS